MPSDSNPENHATNEWSKWLLGRRHGGDAAHQRVVNQDVQRIGDRVLDGAKLQPHMTLVDVGAGDGLIPFAAIDRVGPSLRVIFTDISAPLLRNGLGITSRFAVLASPGLASSRTFIRRVDFLVGGAFVTTSKPEVISILSLRHKVLLQGSFS